MQHQPDAGEIGIDYVAFQAQPEFQAYKRKFRRFVFPLTVLFMAWFFLLVFLAAYAHEFMARPFLGLNVGLWLGLGQFVSTFAITTWYVAYANRSLDPDTTSLRGDLERLESEISAVQATPRGEGVAR